MGLPWGTLVEPGPTPKHESIVVEIKVLVTQVRKEMRGLVQLDRWECFLLRS